MADWRARPDAYEPVPVIDEFGGGHNDGCGPNAATVALAALAGRAPTTSEMEAMRARALVSGMFRAGSGQTIDEVAWEINTSGLPVQAHVVGPLREQPYYSAAELLTLLDSPVYTQGRMAGVIEVASGGSLLYSQPGVQYHIVSVLGKRGSQLLIGNGDRVPLPRGTGTADWIDAQVIANANICAILRIDHTGGGYMGIPAGWTDDGTTLSAPSGHTVVHGFRDYILSHPWDTNNVPLEDEQSVSQVLASDGRWGAGARQIFAASMLIWAPSPDVAVGPPNTLREVPLGRELQVVLSELAQALSTPPTPPAPPAPPAPVPPAITPEQQRALDAVAAIRAALGL